MTSKYYQKREERLQKQAHEKYQNLFKKGKDKKQIKVQERH